MHTHIAIATPTTMSSGVNPPPSAQSLAHTPLDRAQVSLPAVYTTPGAASAAGVSRRSLADGRGLFSSSATMSTSAGEVSWQEYQRVCANERTLTENVQTLKALALQLATQLNQAQAEVQLLEKSASTPHALQGHESDSAEPSASPAPTALTAHTRDGRSARTTSVREGDTARDELLDVIAHKDALIAALQRRLTVQDQHFHSLIDELTKSKDATIERLALELDQLKRSQH